MRFLIRILVMAGTASLALVLSSSAAHATTVFTCSSSDVLLISEDGYPVFSLDPGFEWVDGNVSTSCRNGRVVSRISLS
ncbi:MAG TPA: hypothetical protein VGJ86_19665 [Acidimicrobiales bacterium]|jgi:hypothetical protein